MNRPKILHFTSTIGGGGAEAMLCNLNDALTQKGYETVVVSTTSSDGDHSRLARIQAASTFYDLDAASLRSPGFVIGLWKILRKERPDIVHTWMHTSGLVAGAIARLAGVRNVVWAIHSRDLLCPHGEGCRRCNTLGRALGWASHCIPRAIISCSQAGAEVHRSKYGYAAKPMHCIGNGIDVERFQPRPAPARTLREELGISADAPVIGMVTRPHPVKDLPTFLRAAAILHARRPGTCFVIAGVGPDELDGETAALATSFPAPANLHLIGFQEDTPAVYSMYDILTVASTSEAFPMVLIEALACGTPCVSTDVGDAAEMIGDCGTTVPVGTPEAMADAWEKLLSTSARATADRSRLARERAVEQFSLETCTDAYVRIYEDLLHGPNLTNRHSHGLPTPHPTHHHGH